MTMAVRKSRLDVMAITSTFQNIVASALVRQHDRNSVDRGDEKAGAIMFFYQQLPQLRKSETPLGVLHDPTVCLRS